MTRDPRTERLKSDQRTLLALPSKSSYVRRVRSLVPYQPSDKYQIEFDLPGVISASFDVHRSFAVTLTMGPTYPFREGPRFSIQPVIFHPNVYPSGEICVAAHDQQYVGSFRLIDYIKGIARMIVFTEDKYYLASTARMDVSADYVRWWRAWIDRYEHQRQLPLIEDFYLLDRDVAVRRHRDRSKQEITIRRIGRGARPTGMSSRNREPPQITIRQRRRE